MNTVLSLLVSVLGFDSSHPLLFTQSHFWVFFLLVYAGLYFIITRHWQLTVRNAYLFAVSLFFYYKTSGIFVFLLIFSTIMGWILGIGMDRSSSSYRRKEMMIIGVSINLLILGFFKYAYFFTDIFNETFGTDYYIAIKILLPVGISFYTFQNISYIVDVYKHKIAHVNNVLDFGFYTSFFPQLVAGPILRADQFVPQLYKPFHLTRRQFGLAVFWILNGLVKKIVLSDYLAVNFVDRVFDNPLLYTPFENFSALMVYSLQVYADFSGYTDIAIGVALLMGFHLPVNFNSPYKAQNPTDFWRRWHISLSHWLRDYLYIPLGGNRGAGWLSYGLLTLILAIASFRLHNLWFTLTIVMVLLIIALLYWMRPAHRRELGTNVNNMDTMLLGGMWHGSSFNFITWGGLNGLGILVYKWWSKRTWRTRIITLITITAALWVLKFTTHHPLVYILSFISMVCLVGFSILALCTKRPTLSIVWNTGLTFVFISFTRLFFRSGSNLDPAEANEMAWNTASQMVHQIGSRWDLVQIPEIVGHYWMVFLLFVFGMVIHWLPTRFKRRYRIWFAQMPLWGMAIAVIVTIIILHHFITADLQPFIYFQF
ncbi:MAG: MBOAT family protein [Bacteroidales bacterium]|nr:MBOAT family protein [Bacteroidales bacterium]